MKVVEHEISNLDRVRVTGQKGMCPGPCPLCQPPCKVTATWHLSFTFQTALVAANGIPDF